METLNALTKLVENVKKQPHFIAIKLHVDPKDKSNILLYEEWEDDTYFKTDHMETGHLQKFMTQSINFSIGLP